MLVEAARSGDEHAFRMLVEGEFPALRSRCRWMLDSADEAEDAVQETLLRAWKGLRGFSGQSSLRTWLHRIATNVCLDTIQRRRTRPQLAVDPIDPVPCAPDDAAAPQVRCEQRETVELAFTVARQQLPTRQRAALVLRDVLGFSAKETAATLDTTVASVNSALQRARGSIDGRVVWSGQRDDLGRRFASAIERGDADTVVRLLTQEPRQKERM
jgi:RNA polymerase sigma factor (sigma-70 family)